MSEKKSTVFISFSQSDDHWELTSLLERLSREVQTRIEFPIFQDSKDIRWGQNWQQCIENYLDGVTLLIPILTPAFFNSQSCRHELEWFLEIEKKLKRNDLILPIYFQDTPLLNDAQLRPTDPLAEVIASRQYADWRELRFELDTKLSQLVGQIREALPDAQEASAAPLAAPGAQPPTGNSSTEANLQDQLIEKVRELSSDKQQEALRYLDALADEETSEPNGIGLDRRPIWEVVNEINTELPADTWENVPTDGSINLDHYLYGASKRPS